MHMTFKLQQQFIIIVYYARRQQNINDTLISKQKKTLNIYC